MWPFNRHVCLLLDDECYQGLDVGEALCELIEKEGFEMVSEMFSVVGSVSLLKRSFVRKREKLFMIISSDVGVEIKGAKETVDLLVENLAGLRKR